MKLAKALTFFGTLFLACICFGRELTTEERNLVDHVETCIIQAGGGQSKLTSPILEINGMSSDKVRNFLNNLCSRPRTRYLEVGPWQGSTFISSLYKNSRSIERATVIDNWSKWGHAKQAFLDNCNQFIPNMDFYLISEDAFSVDLEANFDAPVNVYFYDGDHEQISQKMAFTYFDPILDDLFVAVVDDWKMDGVKEGTFEAFKELGYELLFSQALPARWCDKENWWCGLYVAVIRKKS